MADYTIDPHISEQVLTWHHDTHHQGYVNGWNAAEDILADNRANRMFDGSAGIIRNITHNGCGHVLHDLFWQNMSFEGSDKPTSMLADRINHDFDSDNAWQSEFEAARVTGQQDEAVADHHQGMEETHE